MSRTGEPGPALRDLVRTWWPLAALGAVAVLISLWAQHVIFPAYSWNRDEPVYIWQIHALREGQIFTTDGGAPQFFQPWLTGAKDHSFFSQYTLGWPLVLLASDVVFGSPGAGLAIGALLAVLGTYALARELTRDHVLSLVAATAMTLSPILAIQGGVYLGYIFTLGLGQLFAAALLSGLRRNQRWRVITAGVILGWIFLTRPFDALLWGAAVCGYALFVWRKQWRDLVRPALWFALGALPLAIVTLAYNQYVTGKFTQFPITAADPLDKYGFGLRRIMPGLRATNYTVVQAIKSTGKNGFYVPLFMVGSYLGVLVAGFGLWLRRRRQDALLLLALIAIFPLGYFFFWGMRVSAITARISGPIYFVPMYGPLSILLATVILAAWRRRAATAVALVAVLALVTVPFAVNRLGVNHDISDAQTPWDGATDGIRDRALVFVNDAGSYLLFLNPYSENDPDLDDRVLFAVDRGEDNFALIQRMHDRTAYRQQASFRGDELGPRETPNKPKIALQRLDVLTGRAIRLHVRVDNPDDAAVVNVFLDVDGQVVNRTLPAGTREANFTVVPRRNAVPRGTNIPVGRRAGRILVGTGYGSSAADAVTHPSVRHAFAFRTVGPNLELLVPAIMAKKTNVDGARKWRPVLELPELDVDADAAAAGS